MGTGEFVCFWLSVVLIGPKQHHVYICHCFSFLAELFRRISLVCPGLPLPLSPARTSLQLGRQDDRCCSGKRDDLYRQNEQTAFLHGQNMTQKQDKEAGNSIIVKKTEQKE